jgi:hypothetical protein
MTYDQTLAYTTGDRTRTIQFGVKYCPDGYRAYILTPLYYGNRPSDGHTTHRYYDEANGVYYICWDSPITRYRELKTVIALWSELTHAYIRTGETIDRLFARMNKRRN